MDTDQEAFVVVEGDNRSKERKRENREEKVHSVDKISAEERLKKKVAEGQHPLHEAFTFWFNRKIQGARSAEHYEKNIKKIGTFQTVEEFWSFYNHMVRPHDLPTTFDYHLFRKGVKPMWEHEANSAGGKWIVRLRKGLASRYWEDLVLALIGGQFDVGNEVCGVVLSVRFNEDILSVWTRTSSDLEAKLKIHTIFRRALQLPLSTVMEYKNHDQSIKDNSSFRNTEFHSPSSSAVAATAVNNAPAATTTPTKQVHPPVDQTQTSSASSSAT